MSYYLCLKCSGLYDSKYIKPTGMITTPCPNANCHGYIFEVDEQMVIPIMMLNTKGYRTKFCCSGHITKSSHGGYIAFDIHTVPDSVPKGWKLDKEKGYEYETQMRSIRYSFKQPITAIEKQRTVNKKMESLLKWCEELPKYEEETE